MQLDFHYYATYCAAVLAGYSHEESLDIAYSAQFVDLCSPTLIKKLKAPRPAATTQLQLELADARPDLLGLQQMTRIWASFHFLPYDLYAEKKVLSKSYRNKYRLICGPNGDLTVKTVELAKRGTLQSVGIAMHVLADTWAHRYFAGTPSLVINNTYPFFYELLRDGDKVTERKVSFNYKPSGEDDLEQGRFSHSVYQGDERSIMNLGHGRAGHLPDYSFARYKYLPAWNDYGELIKDNPSDYLHAFGQMIYAMKYLRGEHEAFAKETYDWEEVQPWKAEIKAILEKRQLNANEDWKRFGEKLAGETIPEFDVETHQMEYWDADEEEKEDTFLGKFFAAAIAQKSMVTEEIYKSGNLLAGVSKRK